MNLFSIKSGGFFITFFVVGVLAGSPGSHASEGSLCTALKAQGDDAAVTAVVRKSNPKRVPALKSVESYMVQLAVIYHSGDALSPQKAAEQFFDLEYGSSAGSLKYQVLRLEGGKKAEIATAEYYPGDNAYGMVFSVTRDSRTGELSRAQPLAAIVDGDRECLTQY